MQPLDPEVADLTEPLLLDEVPGALLERAQAVGDANLSGKGLDGRLNQLERIAVAEPGCELRRRLRRTLAVPERVGLVRHGGEQPRVGCEARLHTPPVLRRQRIDELLGNHFGAHDDHPLSIAAPALRCNAGTLRAVAPHPPVELHIVSDSTGETAARLVHALEAQFPEQEFEEVRHPRVESVEDLEIAVRSSRGRPAVVIYTLVDPEMRDAMRRLCRRARVHYCDLLGHPIDAVARVSGQAARMTPGSQAPLNPAYFRRIEAMEFAVKYDDGVGAGLDEADIVLVGVSRTSKTPLSIYLGYLGHKVANVPIVKGIEPPKDLWEINPVKIVGLTIEPNRLAEIRRGRLRNLGARDRQYAELMEIYEELDEASKLHRRLGCPVIDISELSIEETAHRVLRVVEERRS